MKTKSEIFKEAHKLAKTFEGDYMARFILALKIIRRKKQYKPVSFSDKEIEIMNIIKETDKAVYVELINRDSTWCPKSLINNGFVPMWLYQKNRHQKNRRDAELLMSGSIRGNF